MTRIMRDGVTLSGIPLAGLDIVATYANGHVGVQTPAAVRARFGTMPVCWIDVNGSDTGADALDVENGDATPAGAAVWVKAKLASKPAYPPVVYCNRSTLTPVFNAMAAAKLVVVRDFRLWIATLDGKTKTVPDMTGVTAVQWLNKPAYDESAVYDDTWKAAPPAPPVLQQGMTGAAVSALQTALNTHGYHLAVDGVFGPATRAAVMSFQKQHGLAADGIAGPLTWAKL